MVKLGTFNSALSLAIEFERNLHKAGLLSVFVQTVTTMSQSPGGGDYR
jgi:hypothetical protein